MSGKVIFNRPFLRGRDEVERAFEECRVSSGERYIAVYMHGLYLHITMDIIIMGGTLFTGPWQCYVFP